MWEVLRLIRIRTIAFAALTMYTMRYMVILPMLELNGFTLQMADWAFTLLVVAVCCLVSGAYVINDYFDTKCDRISGFRTVVVGKSISRRMAITLHSLLNVIAVSIAFYLGFAVGVWKIGILFLLVSGILWLYIIVQLRTTNYLQKTFYRGECGGWLIGRFYTGKCHHLRDTFTSYGLCFHIDRNRYQFPVYV